MAEAATYTQQEDIVDMTMTMQEEADDHDFLDLIMTLQDIHDDDDDEKEEEEEATILPRPSANATTMIQQSLGSISSYMYQPTNGETFLLPSNMAPATTTSSKTLSSVSKTSEIVQDVLMELDDMLTEDEVTGAQFFTPQTTTTSTVPHVQHQQQQQSSSLPPLSSTFDLVKPFDCINTSSTHASDKSSHCAYHHHHHQQHQHHPATSLVGMLQQAVPYMGSIVVRPSPTSAFDPVVTPSHSPITTPTPSSIAETRRTATTTTTWLDTNTGRIDLNVVRTCNKPM